MTGVPGACWWLMVAVPFTVNGMKQLLQLRDTKGIVYIYIYIYQYVPMITVAKSILIGKG